MVYVTLTLNESVIAVLWIWFGLAIPQVLNRS